MPFMRLPIFQSCCVLLCVVKTSSVQLPTSYKCMSLAMYYVTITLSMFKDLEMVLGLRLNKKKIKEPFLLSVLR